jgi:hypothetical protein
VRRVRIVSADTITAIATCVVAVATVVGVCIAARGLGTWRTQLRGAHEFELARRLLLASYKMRTALAGVRRPSMMSGEAGDSSGETPWEVAAYERRWQPVQDAGAELQAVTLECEVVWGSRARDLFAELAEQIALLYQAVSTFVASKQQGSNVPDLTTEERAVLYSAGPDDPYNTSLEAVIQRFEDYVKPHLKRAEK